MHERVLLLLEVFPPMRMLALSSLAIVTTLPLCTLACSASNPAGPTVDSGSTAPEAGAGTEAGACTPFAAPAVSTLQTPTVSFAKDVLPIFQHSCVFSGCHQSQTGGLEFLGDNNDLGPDGGYIGPAAYDAATYPSSYAKQVYDNIVGVPTAEAPSWVFVKPGDPANSFTMHKLDNDLCSMTAQCQADGGLYNANISQYITGTVNVANGACGGFMPEGQYGNDNVTPALLDTVSADGGPGPREIIRRWIAQGAKNN